MKKYILIDEPHFFTDLKKGDQFEFILHDQEDDKVLMKCLAKRNYKYYYLKKKHFRLYNDRNIKFHLFNKRKKK